MNSINRFKDALPQETVLIIKSILKELEIEINEQWYPTGIESLFTLYVSIKNTNIAATGKGSNKDYAMASAYAELIERLQNLMHFRLMNNSDALSQNLKYKLHADEVLINNLTNDEFYNDWINSITDEAFNDNQLFEGLLKLQQYKTNREILHIPFKNIENNQTKLFPITLLDIVYGSNGMAAGNSREEAMVQALCEIIERHSTFELLRDKKALPDITTYIKNTYETLNNIINDIEGKDLKKGSYRIVIKDCSLRKGYPTIMVILFDLKEKKYFVRLGTHPILEIAIERTLTEMVQGRNIDSINEKMNELFGNYDKNDFYKNISNIFLNGEGVYPLELFSDESSCQPDTQAWTTAHKNNQDMLNHLIGLISRQGFEMFYRDVSYLGFNAYQIIVPGYSEVTTQLKSELNQLNSYKDLRRLYTKVHSLGEDERKEFISLINTLELTSDFTLNDLFTLPLVNSNPLNNINKDLLLMIQYILLNDYRNAHVTSINYIYYLIKNKADLKIMNYYKLVSSILYMKSKSFTEEHIKSVLSNSFSLEEINECINELVAEKVDRNLPKIKCPNCHECDIASYCNFEKIQKLFERLMHKQEHFFSLDII